MEISIPEGLKYTKEHEWVSSDGGVATVGITDFAQDQLGDIVFLDLPSVGDEVVKDDTFGVVESVKSVSDLFSPVNGRVTEVNDSAMDSPEVINDDCYGEGWLIKIEMTDQKDLDDLMDKAGYEAFLEELSE